MAEVSDVLKDFSQLHNIQTVTILVNGVLSLCFMGGGPGQGSCTIFTVIGNTETPMMSVMNSRDYLC